MILAFVYLIFITKEKGSFYFWDFLNSLETNLVSFFDSVLGRSVQIFFRRIPEKNAEVFPFYGQ
jgi:hypothetical protein